MISASCELDKNLTPFSDVAIHPWEMHILYNPDGIVKYCYSLFAVDKLSSAQQ